MADPKRALVTSPTIRDDSTDPGDWAQVVAVKPQASTLVNGHETVVSNIAVSVLAANPLRKTAVVQNVGTANIRVGVAGVTATTGLRLIPDAVVIYDESHITMQELFAIRETASDSIAFAQEVV